MKYIRLFISTSVLLFVIVIFNQCDNPKGKIEELPKNIHPLKNSWDFAIPIQEIPEGLTSLSSESCGACHQDHYNEWKLSTHSHAWTDLQFQTELKKESSPFMCINCHIPLQNQQEYIVSGLIDGDIYQPIQTKNPHFDKKLQQEGINCASCHVRNNVIIGPTGSSKAPHKTVKDTLHLSEQLCISCHNAVAVITPTLACTFETADEWRNGPYYEEKDCKSCHMDTLYREVVSGFGKRLSHLHSFPGSGIPKHIDAKTKMLNGLSFHPDEIKQSYSLKDSFVFNFRIKNEHAGHKVPTGDPERFFIIKTILKDSKGEIVKYTENRIGEHWEWYPKAIKVSDNNLLPKEERVYKFAYKYKKKEKYTLHVSVSKHRMSKKTADYNKLGKEYPLSITIYKQEFPFEIK